MDFNIAVLGGDGIGPEVTAEGVKTLEAVGRAFGHNFILDYGDVGGISIDRHGTPLTDGVRDLATSADAVLFGAVGGPKWDDPSAPTRPEDGLLALRAHLNVFANIRPVKVYPELTDSSVLKPHVLEGVDMVVVPGTHRRPVLRPTQGPHRNAPGNRRCGHHALLGIGDRAGAAGRI